MRPARLVLFALLVALSSSFSQQQGSPIRGKWSQIGLEVLNGRTIPIWVQAIGDAEKELGLTDERIRTKCDFKVRQMKLEPTKFEYSYPPQEYQLLVSVQIHRSSFLVEVNFLRRATFRVGEQVYETFATTWASNSFGSHGNDVDHILSQLEGKLEEFLNDFVKVNLK